MNKYIIIALTILNLFIAACGQNTAQAQQAYRMQIIYGFECITNDVSIWCQ